MKKIGANHKNGRIRFDENIALLPLSDAAVSLYKRMLNTANDAVYDSEFAKINGSDAEWETLMGYGPRELEQRREELINAGLVFEKEGGLYIKNYLLFVRSNLRPDRDEFLASVKG